jgi:hypothetical protein
MLKSVSMLSLIPPDSEVPPKKPSDMNRTDQGQHFDVKHAMTILTGSSMMETFSFL